MWKVEFSPLSFTRDPFYPQMLVNGTRVVSRGGTSRLRVSDGGFGLSLSWFGAWGFF